MHNDITTTRIIQTLVGYNQKQINMILLVKRILPITAMAIGYCEYKYP